MSKRLLLRILALNLAFAPAAAWAQQPGSVPVIGYVATAAIGPNDPLIEEFRAGLRDLGYVDGQNIRIEFRSAQGHVDRLPFLAEELVQLRARAIVVGTEPAVRAARQATSTIPIVVDLPDYDPVASGLIDSLGRPGGNITGIFTRNPELVGKRLELLKQALPSLSKVVVFYDSFGAHQLDDLASAARSLGIPLDRYEMRAPYDFKAAFRVAKERGAGAVTLLYSGKFYTERARIAEQALEERVPTMGDAAHYVRAGALMSYGPDPRASYRRLAYFVDRLLKGSKPSELPVEQPIDFQFVLNLKTAKALGIRIPESVLSIADEVIR